MNQDIIYESLDLSLNLNINTDFIPERMPIPINNHRIY